MKNRKKILVILIALVSLIVIGIIVLGLSKDSKKKIDKENTSAKLLYKISYNGLNCKTPILELYDDNTYKFYYSFNGKDKIKSRTGIYNYDIQKIIENVNKYQENKFGPYYIKDSEEKEYVTYNSNKELQELFKSINVTLEKCLIEQ